jgi:uncharacterized membrane protein YjfL (UPF0719 family)
MMRWLALSLALSGCAEKILVDGDAVCPDGHFAISASACAPASVAWLTIGALVVLVLWLRIARFMATVEERLTSINKALGDRSRGRKADDA